MAEYNLGRVGLVIKGEYNNTTQYKKLDVVFFNGRTYVAKQDAKGQEPTNTVYWQQMVYKGKGYNPRGAWEEGENYINNAEHIDVVSHEGVSYFCKQAHVSEVPPSEDVENWDVLINIGSADSISVVNADEYYEADTVEGALSEIYEKLRQHKSDYIEERDEHLNSEMPHIIVDEDNDKTYFFGLRIKDGGTQFMYKEVMVND